MPVSTTPLPSDWTLAELLEHLGGIDPQRVRLCVPPRIATEEDVLRLNDQENRRCELIDGVLVEKCMGLQESALAFALGGILRPFVKQHDLGLLAGPDGAVELTRGIIRYPDVEFFSWEQFPGRKLPRKRIPELAPVLAVEVLRIGNTPGEMSRKLKDYFFNGVRVVWSFDPRKKTCTVYKSPDDFRMFGEKDTLDGGDILPGFKLLLREFFAEVPEMEEETPPPVRKKKRR